jgi:DNA-binding NarL/FixJ family response regulator
MPLSREQLAGVLEERRNQAARARSVSPQTLAARERSQRAGSVRAELTQGGAPERREGGPGPGDRTGREPPRRYDGPDRRSGPADGRREAVAPARITVLVADDHTLFREGVVQMCHAEDDLEVVGQADDTTDAVAIAHRARPDVVLLDVEMPGLGAEESLRQILKMSPNSKVVVLTMHDDARLVKRLLSLGAHAFVVKSATRDELVAAIRTVKRSKDNIVLSVSKTTMERLREPETGPLSARELEILTFVARGYSNAQIASTLYISEGTVKRHLTNIYLKLDVTSRLNAVNKATAMGLLASRVGTC